MQRAGLPTAPPATLGGERFLELMAVDKKVLDGRLRLVLLHDIGDARIHEESDRNELRKILDAYRQ